MSLYQEGPYNEKQDVVKIHLHYVSVICRVLDETIQNGDIKESDLQEMAFYIEKYFDNIDIAVTCEYDYKEMFLVIKYKGNDMFLINI